MSIGGVASFTENFDYIIRGVCIQCVAQCNTLAPKELNYIDYTINVRSWEN